MTAPLQVSITGVPYFDLWILVGGVVAVIAYIYFRTTVKGVPVNVNWIFQNGSAVKLRAEEDLQGVFLRIKSARGKTIETVKKSGLPLEVMDASKVRNGTQYYVVQTDQKDSEGKPITKVVLNVALSQMKHVREYTVVEGTGQTIDWLDRARKQVGTKDTGNAVVLHEERSAAKEFFKDLAVALSGTFRALVLPLIAGGGLGVAITLLLLILSGHFR